MFQKILVAVDDSEPGKQAYDTALVLAKTNQAQLMLFHALTHFSQGYPDSALPRQVGIMPAIDQAVLLQAYSKQWDEFEQKGLNYLKSLTDQATSAGIPTEFTQTVGDPGHLICDLARTWEADLIIIGSRGYTGLKELFMGSVSNYVTHHASCSVLTVRQSIVEPLAESTDKILGFKLSGKLRDKDYKKFAPVIEQAIAKAGHIRLLLEFDSFQGWDTKALWDDVKVAAELGYQVDRIAIVGDRKWEEWINKLCKPFSKAEVHYFATLDSARQWVREGTD